MTNLTEMLDQADPQTGFVAVAVGDKPWVQVEITPSELHGYWHIAVIEAGGVAKFFKRPVQAHGVELFLPLWGVVDADFKAVHREPRCLSPWDPGIPDSGVDDVRNVYFIQGVDGGPIKIGVAADPAERLASIQLMSPVRLRILGAIRGVGQPEERRLHQRFARYRLHGEWFQPAPELLDYIKEDV